MNQDRQIRFLIPPLVFILSLLWGAHLSGKDLTSLFGPDVVESILGLLALGAVTAISLGFIIGTISINLLRVMFCVFGRRTYEAVLSKKTLKRIWPKMKTALEFDSKYVLNIAATFDHEIISKGVHEWLTRRWSSFNISVSAIVALLLSHIIAPFIPINQSWCWGITSVILGIFFLGNAIFAWRETMEMIDFQSHRKHSSKR